MIKSFIASLLFICNISEIRSQSAPLVPRQIKLPAALSNPDTFYEFSSVAKWNNKILLVPAFKKRADFRPHKIFTIDSLEIIKGLADTSYQVKTGSIDFDMELLYMFMDSIAGYDGIEGTVVVDSSIFFSVETSESLCYIVKAAIDTHDVMHPKIILLQKKEIPKPTLEDPNWGFEGLSWLPDQKKLIAVFENSVNNKRTFYKMNRQLKGRVQLDLRETTKGADRMPDICVADNNILIGLTSRYDNEPRSETCSAIVKIDLRLHTIMPWKKIYNNLCADVWEGILPFNGGVLLVNDNCNFPKSPDPSKLAFLTVKYSSE